MTDSVTTAPTTALEHVSFSQVTDWLKCGKYFQLKRLLNLPEKPAVWNIGGHAVHAATEAHDRQYPDGQ